MICTCMCCSSAWPQPGGSQTACRIRHCCKLQATPRSGRFPGGSWSLSDGGDRKKNIKYESQIKGCRAFWASGEDLKESQLFIILKSQFKNQPCCSKVENFTGSGGLIWIEVSVILYTQKQEGNKTSSQSKGSITAADHRQSIKKTTERPFKSCSTPPALWNQSAE